VCVPFFFEISSIKQIPPSPAPTHFNWRFLKQVAGHLSIFWYVEVKEGLNQGELRTLGRGLSLQKRRIRFADGTKPTLSCESVMVFPKRPSSFFQFTTHDDVSRDFTYSLSRKKLQDICILVCIETIQTSIYWTRSAEKDILVVSDFLLAASVALANPTCLLPISKMV